MKMSMKTDKKNNKSSEPPSFGFKWDSKTQPQGKAVVFAKKKTKSDTVTKKIPTETHKQSDNVKKPDVIAKKREPIVKSPTILTQITKPVQPVHATGSTNESEIVGDPPRTGFGHIKRKQKKDKLIAKQLAQQGLKPDAKTNDPPNYSLFNVRRKDIYVNTSAGRSVSEKLFTTGSFKDLGLHDYVVSNLEKHGFKNPTNVQTKAIPVVCSGKNTLIRSQTGSGKTLAYAVPIIDALQGIQPRLKRTDGIQAIIVVPTRELAIQSHELFTKLNTFQWVVVGHLCGGENRKTEKDRIKKGINVLIGTPGRLLDHVLHTTAMKVDQVRCLVLDEADRLLDMGFRKDIISLVEALDSARSDNLSYDPMKMLKKSNVDEDDVKSEADEVKEIDESVGAPLKTLQSKSRQNIMLSATLTKEVSELASFTMKDHTYIDALDMTSNAIVGSYVIPDTVQQEFIMTHAKHRLFTLAALLLAKSKKPNCKLFVFMASTQMVEFHYELFSKYLTRMPINRGKSNAASNMALHLDDSDAEVEDDDDEEVMDTKFFKLHGSMVQKERKEVFKEFRACKKGILICSDVVARGIDVPAADCIIQYTGPQMDDDYLHRVGRTGRAGQSGSAIIFLTHEEQDYVDHLREHRVFLKKREQQEYLQELTVIMEEPNYEQAATLLQRRLETAVEKDKALYKSACSAYTTWSRFYNSFPVKMRKFFDFKKANLGHYVTSFALRLTPTEVARIARGEVTDVEPTRLNKKLANHSDNAELRAQPEKRGKMQPGQRRRMENKSLSFLTSDFASGLEPLKKKKKIDN